MKSNKVIDWQVKEMSYVWIYAIMSANYSNECLLNLSTGYFWIVPQTVNWAIWITDKQ